jgi:hypothetical protein
MLINDLVNPMDAAHLAPRCQHVKVNGKRCGAPAVRRSGCAPWNSWAGERGAANHGIACSRTRRVK